MSGEVAGASDAEVVPLNAVVTTATATTPVDEIRLDRLDMAKKNCTLQHSWKEHEIMDKSGDISHVHSAYLQLFRVVERR